MIETGTLNLNKDGQTIKAEEDMTGAQLKKVLALPPDSFLINARNQVINDNDRVGDKCQDGEAIAAQPSFKYW